MRTSPEQLGLLRQKMASLEGQTAPPPSLAPLGHAEIDAALGGGLARGRLHEIHAANEGDSASTAGFAAMLAARLKGNIIWLRPDDPRRPAGALYGPGLVEIGIDPAQIIIGSLHEATDILRAAAEALRSHGTGVIIAEIWHLPRVLDFTASRRLALAAEAAEASILLMRVKGEITASAAQTRWSVASAPSEPLEAGAPGHPTLFVELIRQRGRPESGRWLLEWDRDQSCFISRTKPEKALPGVVFPASADRQAGALRRSA